MNDPDLDAEFARIIAGWDNEAPDPTPGARASGPGQSSDTAESPESPSPHASGESGESGESGSPDAQRGAGASAEAPPAPTAGAAPTGWQTAGPTAGADGDAGAAGTLDLPIAPSTAHVWRGAEPPRDDVDDLLDAVEPDEEHFVPPTDPDLPSAEDDPMFWAIVVGLAGGPLLLLYILFFDRDGSPWWVVTALAMIVVGFVLLVLRGGTERDPSDDGTRV